MGSGKMACSLPQQGKCFAGSAWRMILQSSPDFLTFRTVLYTLVIPRLTIHLSLLRWCVLYLGITIKSIRLLQQWVPVSCHTAPWSKASVLPEGTCWPCSRIAFCLAYLKLCVLNPGIIVDALPSLAVVNFPKMSCSTEKAKGKCLYKGVHSRSR